MKSVAEMMRNRKMHLTTSGDPRYSERVGRRHPQIKYILSTRDNAPNIMAPSSSSALSRARTASAKKIRKRSGLKIQPSRVPCAIGKVGENPSGPLADPLMSLYNAMILLTYTKGIPISCILWNKISRRTRGNALRISTKQAKTQPPPPVSRWITVKSARMACAQLPSEMKPRCCWGKLAETKGKIRWRMHDVYHL